MQILRQKEEEERQRSEASMKWMEENKKYLQERQSKELKIKQSIQKRDYQRLKTIEYSMKNRKKTI